VLACWSLRAPRMLTALCLRPGPPVVVGPQSPLGSPPPWPLSSMDLGFAHQLPRPRPRPAPVADDSAAEIRGVGIKFGERLEPASGGINVYVKRLVNDSPAHRCGLISPGDVLVLIDGEDVFGWGLAWLRNKIPGPAGSWVRLGFRGAGGRLFEVPLCRTAYGSKHAMHTAQKKSRRVVLTQRPQY